VYVKQRGNINISSSILLFVLLLPFAASTATPNIEVERSIDEQEVTPGGKLEVSLNISVSGDARAMIVTEKLPPAFNITTSKPSFSKYNPATGEVVWLLIGRMGVSNATIIYTVEVFTTLSEGIYPIKGNWSAVSTSGTFHGETPPTEVRIEKLKSTISLSISPSKVKIGDAITVTGSFSPRQPNVNITLTYVKPDNSLLKRNVTTSSDGGFVDSYKANANGAWSITASWPGDYRYKGAESPKISFMVETSIEQWSVYVIILIPVVIVTVLGAIIFLLRR